ncbi:hypothetical protein X566_15460 [Afipia sp. P52-10]|uniref:hypothetical protein n=1 Tax=Afipia sp. P52-10 TaxID=1429916 RepID=UPI0003DF37BD|nr:hypothetical protein [Afipia sp. P52-10]ETR79167.1 hypothetical protein X566_15460 [Afipia sp. P52-10]
MSGTSAGWTPERRAAQARLMRAQNADPAFVDRRNKGPQNLPAAERAARSARIKAMNADPAFQAKRREGIAVQGGRKLAIPEHTHPCVRGMFVAMNDQRASRHAMASRVGMNVASFTAWRRKHMPRVDDLDAALNALDLELAIVPKGTRDADGFCSRRKAL